jgi:predicted transcriptional regulator of viral defense system
MRTQSTTAEQELARIAGRSHGVATRAELLEAGVSADQIGRRVRKGLLLVEYPGVYRVGHRAPSVEARYMAAVKACGEGAVLCGRSAAHLLGLVRTPSSLPEVAAPTKRRIRGVRTTRLKLHPTEVTRWRGIPTTTVARTIVDNAAALDEDELARAVHEAAVRHRTTPPQVEAVLERRPNAPGAATLKAVLRGDVKVTLSKLEKVFLKRLREANLPLPETNRRTGGRYLDCRWPEHALTVEIDGYRYHHSRHAWEQDRRREREAYDREDEHRRYTYADVMEDPRQMLRELRKRLSP